MMNNGAINRRGPRFKAWTGGQYVSLLRLGWGFGLMLAFAHSAVAQTGCELTNTYPLPEQLGLGCSESINFAPMVPQHTPVKRVRVALHSFQLDDGTGNFQNTAADLQYLENVIWVANGMLENMGQLNIGNTPFIADTRIQIELAAVYFHPHTSDWTITLATAASRYTEYVILDADGYGMTNADKYEVQHVLLRGAPSGCCDGASVVGDQGWMTSGSWYSHYQVEGPTSFSWKIPGHFLHELFHGLGLEHNFHGGQSGYQCDGCFDNDPSGLDCPIEGTSNNLMDYWPNGYNSSNPGPGLSECQLGMVHYNLDGNSGTINQVVLKDYCDYNQGATISVSGTHVWNASKKLRGDLIVEAGAQLTIKCRVHMPEDGRIIVRQGGKLIIDEGHITNLCGHFWSGIEAWGTSDQHQGGSPIPDYQSMVIVKNGGILEHAREGIQTMNPNDWSMIGGVVQCTDAKFINCRRAVSFVKYENFNPNTLAPMPNRSSFLRTEFIVDNDYRASDDFYAHVSMWEVNGIRFRECAFANLQNSITESHKLGYGIISIDAGYTVTGSCTGLPLCEDGDPIPPCPPANLLPGKFIGLDHGIHALGTGSNGYTFTANQCVFQNNICGVYTNGVNNFTVTRNKFTSGNRDVDLTEDAGEFWWIGHRAVYNTGGIGFRIEENDFGKDPGSPQGMETEGTVIGFGGPFNNQVYLNRAEGVDHAFIGEGNNYDANDPAGTGLGFYCNANSDNGQRDFVVRIPPEQLVPLGDEAIKQDQGSSATSAGNSFTSTQNGAYTYYNYDNEAIVQPVVYFWQAPPGQLNAGAYNFPWVVESNIATLPNDCPSLIVCGNGGVKKSILGPQIEAEKQAHDNLKYVFESLLDGGDFGDLQNTIMNSWPTDAWDLRNELMAKSPYLSVEILYEAAERNVLPDAMMLEVCLANPDATRQDGFVRWIKNSAPRTLPQYMVNQIMSSWDNNSFRTSLEAAIAQHRTNIDRMNTEIIVALRNDTLPEPVDSVLVRWQQDPSLGARYGEAQTLIELGRFAEANTLIAGLAEDYRLSQREVEAQSDMLVLMGVYATANSTGQDMMHLNATQQNVLRDVADGAINLPTLWARNLLCFGYQECYQDVTGGSMPVRAATQGPDATGVATSGNSLSVYPVPAGTWVAFDYHMNSTAEEGSLVVRDVTGRLVEQLPVQHLQGQQVWDTRGQEPGTYLVELIVGDNVVGKQPFVINP